MNWEHIICIEHGEILFEIKTNPPGFAYDESYEPVCKDLKLPSQYEQYRELLNTSFVYNHQLTGGINMNELKGIHHITAITSSAEKIYDFFTYVLGMRLVKKTVNQDDIQTYHLFFSDDVGRPGTDMTFFDFPGIPKGVHGTNEISKTSFRVPTDEALNYWLKRFNRLEVKHTGIKEQFGKKILSFVDFDDQQYQLISDENNKGVASATPWQKGPISL